MKHFLFHLNQIMRKSYENPIWWIPTILLWIAFILVTISASAQTWNTYAGTLKDPVITFTQFGNGWNIAITGTTAKYYLANFKCPACPVCAPPIDPKSTPEYTALQAQLSTMTTDRDKQARDAQDLRQMLSQEINLVNLYQYKNDSLASVNAVLFDDIRRRKAEMAKYKRVTILLPNDTLR
jgi:hypothetical protein